MSDYHYFRETLPPQTLPEHKRYRVRMFVPGQQDVTLVTTAVNIETVIDQVNNRRLPVAPDMSGFEVTEIND